MSKKPATRPELVSGMMEVRHQAAIKGSLALLAETHHGVQLGTRLVGHDRAQELDVVRRHRHLDHEVGAGEGKQQADPAGVEDHAIDDKPAARIVQYGYCEGVFAGSIHRLADDVGRLVAVKRR